MAISLVAPAQGARKARSFRLSVLTDTTRRRIVLVLDDGDHIERRFLVQPTDAVRLAMELAGGALRLDGGGE